VTALFEPPVSDAAAEFWNATRERRLVLPWCTFCELPFWYPREVCPRCLDHVIEWRETSGMGEVHAASVQHRPGPMRDANDGPYTVALVDLPEGVRIMSNVVGCPPETVTVGMEVRLAWHELPDGRHLPQFEPAEHDEGGHL
jgi:uncharacterized OB-fold protein